MLRAWAWIASSVYQALSLKQARGVVQMKERDCCSADCRFSDQGRMHQSEMFVPALHTWVEQRHQNSLYWVDCREVRTFAQIALHARERQIPFLGESPMLECPDVVNMVGKIGIVLMQQTVFAAFPRALDDGLAE